MRVLKFGGASVKNVESFSKVAFLIAEKRKEDPSLVVVVSAMGKTTDELLHLAHQVHPEPPKRELDMLVSTGERISISLLAMALHRLGIEAVSFTGSQSGIITDENHAAAKIVKVTPHRVRSVLERGQIAIVAGFQGVSSKGEITTLGRGGSDTTAVALAAALKAPLVEFYKDVPGIFHADPKTDPHAQFLPTLSYIDALTLAQKGAKVLEARAIRLAEKNQICLSVQSFLDPKNQQTIIGTLQDSISSEAVFEHEVSYL